MYQLDHPWLLALLPLPLLVWWLLPAYREESASVRLPFFDEIARAAGVSPTQGSVVPRTNWAQKLLAPVCWALIVRALARPQFVEPPLEKTEPQRDLMLSLDLSQSMDTRDFRDPSDQLQPRADAVRKVVADFVARRPGHRIGLIAFGDAPYPLVPFTIDHRTVQAMLADTLPGMAGPRTALGDSIGLAIKMFADSPAPDKVLVVLTDGNDTASKMPPDKAADIARQNKITVHTVGIGDPSASGEDKLDQAALQKIAQATGGRYFFGEDQNQLADIYATLDRITPANQKTLSWRPRIELFHYPLGYAHPADRLPCRDVAQVRPQTALAGVGPRGRGMIADFHFLRPWWLLALIAAVALPWLLGRQTDVRARWRGMIAPGLLDHLVITRQAARKLRPVHLAAAAIALGAIATAGPTWERERPPFVEDTAPLAIAIDLSQTMDATDISPSRLERAKLKIQDLLDRRKGARTAVFAYAGSAHMVLPLTDDAALIRTYTASLVTRLMPVPGKDTAKALEAAEAGLANEEAPGTILFLTDGVEQAAFGAFSGYRGRHDLMVLGIGTAEGGPVRTGEGAYLTDSAGARVFAKLDVDGLKALQRQSSVQVATVTADDADVDWIVRRIQTAFQQKVAEGATGWRDMGWWLTFPIAALAALWFRRGWSVQWTGVLLAVMLFALPDRADAADRRFAGMWLTPDQQGRLAFERGDYAGAAERFRDPAWRGVALYRAGKFGQALDAFAQSDTAESYYNQGNALMHLARPEQAVAAYGQALKTRPDWAEAKANSPSPKLSPPPGRRTTKSRRRRIPTKNRTRSSSTTRARRARPARSTPPSRPPRCGCATSR